RGRGEPDQYDPGAGAPRRRHDEEEPRHAVRLTVHHRRAVMKEDADRPAPLSDENRRALDHVLDELIPPDPDRGPPGAGQRGLGGYVDTALDTMPFVKEMIVQSLAMLNELAARRAGRRFSELPHGERAAVLDELAAGEHGFPPVLVLYAYAGYYQHPHVL